ncbi:MAG: TlpA family protein disulfide reductase [Thermoanaerobaculia bacterium]
MLWSHETRFRERRTSACALTAVALLLIACTAPGAKESSDFAAPGPAGPAVGDRVAFRLPALDGGQLGPADFPGRVVLLDFWATWCVPCRAQKAVLEEVAADYPEGSLHVLAVNVGEDEGLVRESVADEASPFPIVLDRDTSFFTSLGLVALPSLVVLDGEGRLVEQATGLIDARSLREMIRKAGLEPAEEGSAPPPTAS